MRWGCAQCVEENHRCALQDTAPGGHVIEPLPIGPNEDSEVKEKVNEIVAALNKLQAALAFGWDAVTWEAGKPFPTTDSGNQR